MYTSGLHSKHIPVLCEYSTYIFCILFRCYSTGTMFQKYRKQSEIITISCMMAHLILHNLQQHSINGIQESKPARKNHLLWNFPVKFLNGNMAPSQDRVVWIQHCMMVHCTIVNLQKSFFVARIQLIAAEQSGEQIPLDLSFFVALSSYMSDGRNYLFGEYAITKSGWSPIGY